MGFKDLFGGNKGESCSVQENGTISCVRASKEGDQLVADGTNINIQVDSQCNAMLVGDNRIMDNDKEWVGEKLKSAEQSCRKGIA